MIFREACGSIGRWLLPAASLCAVCASSAKSSAAENGTTVAHDVATEGFSAFEAGRYEEANEKLSRALDLIGVPTMALYAARTNVKLKHWVKASELYLLASRLSPKSAADITQLQAQHEAEKERAALLARVPRLTVELKGDDLESVQVSLDSEPIPSSLLGANQLVDPGHHVIRATRDGQAVTGELDVDERQHKTTTLYFARREPQESNSQTLPSIATSTESMDTFADPFSEPTSTPVKPNSPAATGTVTNVAAGSPAYPAGPRLRAAYLGEGAATSDGADNATTRTLGWIGVGVGAVGLLVGATTGLMAMSARSKLLESGDCRESLCLVEAQSDVDRYNSLRTWSVIGFVSGGLFAAAGATVLLAVPKEPNDLRAALLVGPGTATVVGSF